MSALLEKYGLDKLTPEETRDLLEVLQDKVDQELESEPLTSEEISMLETRLARMRDNPQPGVPWETVRDEARARWKK